MATYYSSSSSSNTGSSTLTFAHSVNASADFLVVAVSHRRGADDVSGVTYNGVSLTRAASSISNAGEYIYYLASPATGSNNVVVTISAGTDRALVATALDFSGIEQVSPVDVSDGSGATGTSLTDSVTTTVADTVIVQSWQQIGGSDATLTPSSITEVADVFQTGTLGTNHASGYRIETATGTYTSGWSSSASNQMQTVLVAFIGVAATNEVKSINGVSNV